MMKNKLITASVALIGLLLLAGVLYQNNLLTKAKDDYQALIDQHETKMVDKEKLDQELIEAKNELLLSNENIERITDARKSIQEVKRILRQPKTITAFTRRFLRLNQDLTHVLFTEKGVLLLESDLQDFVINSTDNLEWSSLKKKLQPTYGSYYSLDELNRNGISLAIDNNTLKANSKQQTPNFADKLIALRDYQNERRNKRMNVFEKDIHKVFSTLADAEVKGFEPVSINEWCVASWHYPYYVCDISIDKEEEWSVKVLHHVGTGEEIYLEKKKYSFYDYVTGEKIYFQFIYNL